MKSRLSLGFNKKNFLEFKFYPMHIYSNFYIDVIIFLFNKNIKKYIFIIFIY